MRESNPRRTATAVVSAVALALIAGMVAGSGTAAVARPTRPQIDEIMKRTVEVRDRSEHFAPLGRLLEVTVGDGQRGSLSAVLGTRFPTADGYGQLVCCPSLHPVAVSYRWVGTRLVASGTPPRNLGLAAVRLL